MSDKLLSHDEASIEATVVKSLVPDAKKFVEESSLNSTIKETLKGTAYYELASQRVNLMRDKNPELYDDLLSFEDATHRLAVSMLRKGIQDEKEKDRDLQNASEAAGKND